MRLSLIPHPDFPTGAVGGIDVEVGRRGRHRLELLYRVRADFRHLEWPRPAAPEPKAELFQDELWRHTCFELFLAAAGADEYLEYNLASSGAWAAYRFSGYRAGMEKAQVPPPRIEADLVSYGPVRQVKANLPLAPIGSLPTQLAWRVGIAAVIEERYGRFSYWALAHPPGKPDFHHPDCFALELPAARPA
jgi:hypothetical protein